jgi:hypothetical protein
MIVQTFQLFTLPSDTIMDATLPMTSDYDRRLSWHAIAISPTSPAFEPTSKRRRGFPSESRVKRGLRFVHGDGELIEKLGRNDPCVCGSGKCF